MRRRVSPDDLARSLPDVLVPLGGVARRLVLGEGLTKSLPDVLPLAGRDTRWIVSWKVTPACGILCTTEDDCELWHEMQFLFGLVILQLVTCNCIS